VASALEIQLDEVEMWVVSVVTQGLIGVKIDQPKQTITVRHTEQQVFEVQQWARLNSRLETVKHNIQDLLVVVQKLKKPVIS